MQQFIDMATSRLGVGEDTAKSATGAVMNLVKERLGDGEFQQLSSAVPGLVETMDRAGASGGGIGGLMGKAAGMFGGQAGAAAGLLGVVTSAGLSVDQAGTFVTMLFNFIKDNAGADLVNTIMKKIPEIRAMVA